MKKTFILLSLLVGTVFSMQAQVYNQMDPNGNITQRDEFGNNGSFNPNRRDTTKQNKEVPIGLRFWKIDRRFGDVIPSEPDTVPHLYQNSIYATGLYGQYNTLGNNYTPRINRIFIDRPETSQCYFTQPYSFTTKQPDEFLFVNTLSPYTHITYETCGDKQNGEDHIDAKFAVNAGKRVGMGFDLDYHYATGYYANQNNSHFRATLFGSYIGDQYQMHSLLTFHHRKATESGGIINDEYITHPEAQESAFNEDEIPTVLSSNWNRNNSQHFFLSHRYNLGFYRKVKMTEEEIKAKQFALKSAQQKKEREERGKDQPMESGRKGAKVQDSQPAGRPDGAAIMGDAPEAGKKPVLSDSTRIKVVVIPEQIKFIEADAFKNCTGVEKVYFTWDDPRTITWADAEVGADFKTAAYGGTRIIVPEGHVHLRDIRSAAVLMRHIHYDVDTAEESRLPGQESEVLILSSLSFRFI